MGTRIRGLGTRPAQKTILVAIMTLTLTVGTLPPTASAHNPGPPFTDGCTAVPDRGSYLTAQFDFLHACVHHMIYAIGFIGRAG
jgi:hypothetical protein